MTTTTTTKTIDSVLAAARARLRRLSPHEARAAWARGALLIDIRPAQRPERQTLDGATVSRGAPSRRSGRSERTSGFNHSCRYC